VFAVWLIFIMFDIVTVGHATIDFFLELYPKTADVIWSKKKKDSYVCLDFADKTPVKDIGWSLGGNALNSGIGLSRLGVNAALLTDVGQDEWGQLIRQKISSEKINLDYFSMNPGEKTDLSIILTLNGERTILSYHHPRKYHFPDNFPECRWLYLTSLGEKFLLFHRQLLNLLNQREIKLAFNPGTYELLAGYKENQEIIKRCELLFVNREEAGELVGQKPLEVNNQLLEQLRNLGPKVVIITDGEKGSYAYDGKHFYHQPILPVNKIEMTGAGDSFSAAFLAARISGGDIYQALKWGTVNSASVIQQVGSTKGLLTRREMEERVDKL